jgi:hypothetical protein
VLGTFGGLGGALSIGGFAVFAKTAIDAADALNDMSARTGVAIETLAGLDYAAKLGDTSLDAISKSIGRLNKSIGEAGAGNAAMAESLAALGVTAKDPAEAMAQLADYVQRTQDPTKRAAELTRVLGKSYQDLIPLLENGGDALERFEGRRELLLLDVEDRALRHAGLRRHVGAGHACALAEAA